MNKLIQNRCMGRAAAAVLVLGILSGCAGSGVNRGDVNLVSLEEEWQLGQRLEQDIAQQLPVIDSGTAVRYLNQVGQSIVAQTQMRNLPWEFHLVADPSINAFNIPGGHVYVHTGLIAAADNAAELVGVLAHEISHGVSRHATEQLTKNYGISAVAGLLIGQNQAIYEQLLAQIVGGGVLAKFSRDAEREADQLGVTYMYQAGFDPMGMATMFEELLSQSRREPGSVEQFFSTHPLTSERIENVTEQARQLPDRNLRMTDAGFDTFRQRAIAYNR